MSSNLTIAFGVPWLSHNVVVKHNITTNKISRMATILMENKYTIFDASNKLVGALDPIINLGTLFSTPL